MLILDKARALDLMVARSERVMVPDEYVASWVVRPVASYEPTQCAALAEPAAAPVDAGEMVAPLLSLSNRLPS